MGVDDEAELVARLRSGDAEAFDAIYDEYRPRIFGFLLRLSRRRTVAEDLLDETFLRLVRHAPALRTDTNLGAWLFTVARNLYWSYRRASALEDDVEPLTLSLWPITAPGSIAIRPRGGQRARVQARQGTAAICHRSIAKSCCW